MKSSALGANKAVWIGQGCRLCLSLVAAAMVASSVLAADKTYVGADGGDWSVGSNWSPAGVPGEGDVAVFDNAVTVEIADGASFYLGGFAFNASATVVSGQRGAQAAKILFPDGTSTVYVAQGVTATVGAQVASRNSGQAVLVKDGEGTFRATGYVGYSPIFKHVEVAAGELFTDFSNNNDGFKAPTVHVRRGAVLKAGGFNQFYNDMHIELDEGAVYDAQSHSDLLGGVSGAGVATNMASQSFTLRGDTDYVFTGTFVGSMQLGNDQYNPAESHRFVVGAATALEGATVSVTEGWSGNLAFAPEIGHFRIGSVRNYNGGEYGLVLQDTEGGPVRVDTYPGTDRISGTVSGPGSLGLSQVVRLTDGAPELALSGGLGAASGGTTIFGDNMEGETFSFGNVSGLFADDANLRFNLWGDFMVDIPVAVTNGQLQQWGMGDLTFASVSLSNAIVRSEQQAGATTILSGKGHDVNIQNNSTNGAFIVQDCVFDGVEVNNGTWNSTPVVFRNSEVANMKIGFSSNTASKQRMEFHGGRYVVTNNNFGVYASNSVLVTGGELTLLRGQSTAYNWLEMPWTFTGGRSIFYHPMSWNQGFGADISGEGTFVRLMNTNLFETTSRAYRVASDGYSHVVRVRDGGHLVSDGFVMNSPGTSVVSTGAVEVLEGGTWMLCTGLTGMGGENDALKWSYLFFNGGVFESGGSYDYANSGILLSTAAHHFTWVGEKGFTLRHAPKSLSCGYAISVNAPLVPYPGAAADGGIVRTGHGALMFYAPIALHGPYDHRDGAMRFYSASASAPMGYGDVILGGVIATFNDNAAYSAATDSGATVTIRGATEFQMSDSGAAGSTLTLGAADAAANSVLVRGRPGSTLMIFDYLGSNNTAPFGDGPCKVKVNGGVASSAVTGLPAIPAVGLYRDDRTGDRYAATPLAYDAVKGFVRPTFADNDFTGGASSHVRVLTETTLSENAAVGSLSVFGCASQPLTLGSGVTLSIGDGVNPAILVLNSSSSHNTVAGVTGGTIDFGGSEGVIASAFSKGNSMPSTVASVIAGCNGLTISAFLNTTTLIAISAANVYEGETYVNNVLVHVKNAQAFSLGKVHVLGAGSWGGALLFDTAMTFANPLHVSGYGIFDIHDQSTQTPRGPGALRFTANTTLSGPVELGEGATRFTSSAVATFNGAMSGPGAERLEFAGAGSFVLSGASDCTNAVEVCDGTTVRVASSGALGSGPLEVNGKLVFANATAGMVPGRVSGDGEIVLSGAEVRFADLSAFTGTIRTEGTGVIDLMGKDMAASALVGDGVVTNSGAAATLSVASAEGSTSEFSGTIGGDITLVKTGDGTQHLSGTNTYAGATVVEGGALVLRGRDIPDTLPVADAVLRLDATTLSGLADGDAVSEWSDADGRGWTFNNPAEVYPTYSSDAMNGRPALWFGALTQTRLLCAATFQTRTIFAAYRASSGSHNWGCAGFFGYANNDRGLRFDNNSSWSTSGWNNKAVSFGINGVSGVRTFKNNEAAVVSAEYDSAHAAGTYAVGDYWADTRYNRFYYGWIGELIVYDRVLTDDEKAQVNDYLMKKWGVKEYETPPAMTNVLPETTALTVSGEGVLDLAGGSHTVASLAGDGLVTNSAAESAELRLTGAAADAFTGRILGDVTLTLVGGASIDLGGATVPAAAVAGTGRVANGTLAVSEIKPGGMGAAGTLTFERAPASGATYVFDGFGNAADLVVVEGAFDLSTMALRLAPFAISEAKCEILSVEGTRTGDDFSSLTSPYSTWTVIHLGDGSSWLVNKRGTLLIFR